MSFIESVISSPLWLLLLYVLPLILCLYGYIIRTWVNIRKDIAKRQEVKCCGHGYYESTDTIGNVVGRILVSFIPVINIFAALFDVAPEVFSRIFDRILKVLSYPIVPPCK